LYIVMKLGNVYEYYGNLKRWRMIKKLINFNLHMSKTAIKLTLHLFNKFIRLKILWQNTLNAFIILRNKKQCSIFIFPLYAFNVCYWKWIYFVSLRYLNKFDHDTETWLMVQRDHWCEAWNENNYIGVK
jgi:hypothetical protein